MDDTLPSLLAPFDAAVLDRDPCTIYVVDADLRIRFVNKAWAAFAREHGAPWAGRAGGAWDVGSSVLDAVPPVLKPFYEELFARARIARAPVEHTYECSTPTHRVHYRMRILPCGQTGLLVTHSVARDEVHPGPDCEPLEARYRAANGMILQCSHCRRVRRVGSTPPTWDWVPAYVEQVPASSSHGLCEVCLDYYYPR